MSHVGREEEQTTIYKVVGTLHPWGKAQREQYRLAVDLCRYTFFLKNRKKIPNSQIK